MREIILDPGLKMGKERTVMLNPVFFDTEEGRTKTAAMLDRQFEIDPDIENAVKDILRKVRESGDEALVGYTREFDCPHFEKGDMVVSASEMDAAYSEVDGNFMRTVGKAIANITDFHRHQVPESWFTTREDGVFLGQMVNSVDAAGLYVPGGQGGETPLVSSVLMNAVPARIAGVKRLVMATPPTRQGGISPFLLVAAAEAGVTEILKMGSAWAVGAMAYGTETVEPVDVIVGPGNIFVTLAKKMVAGAVGIDMIAGPSEVLIIADGKAVPGCVAADLLSQAEHDSMATSVLITPSPDLAIAVSDELSRQLGELTRSETAEKSLCDNGLLLVVDDLDTAAAIANRFGAEHLELMVEDPWGLLPRIRHAGAVFLGSHTPEPVGDYIAGPNHVLPTMGTARFSSALGVETFLKRSSIIAYTREALMNDAEDVMRLARIEGLTAHAESIRKRM